MKHASQSTAEYEEGYKAYVDKKPFDECPYGPMQHYARSEWQNGWLQAANDLTYDD